MTNKIITPEYNKELVKQIKTIVELHQKSFAIVLKSKKNRHLYEYILESTKVYPNLRLCERIYWLIVDLHEYPKCKVCNKNSISHKAACNPLTGYKTYHCSGSCAQKDPDYRKELEERNIQRCGKKYVQLTDEYRKKMSDKLLTMPQEHWDNARIKREKTCERDYGYKNVSQHPAVKAKLSYSQKHMTPETKSLRSQRTKKTKKERYGDENYYNVEKCRETRYSKYDGKWESEEATISRKLTVQTKYHVDCISQCKEIKDKMSDTRITNQRTLFYNTVILNNDFVEPLFSLEEYIKSANDTLKWRCKKCKNIFESKKYEHLPFLARCLHCYPLLSHSSQTEKQIAEYIKNISSTPIILGSRSIIPPKELDIYLPEYKLAIEYNGLYWHSLDYKGLNMYHLNKTLACEEKNILLIHIFENEWLKKQDIVKNQIKCILNIYDVVINENDYSIKEIDNTIAKTFLFENCIYDNIENQYSIGAYSNDLLVCVMTFCKSKNDPIHDWRLTCICYKLGYKVINAANKILNMFEQKYHPKSLVCNINRRLNNGNELKELGFVFDHATSPNYFYWNYRKEDINLIPNYKFQKNKLALSLKNYNANLTEYQNMANNGYLRIFDCGSLVFVKTYT